MYLYYEHDYYEHMNSFVQRRHRVVHPPTTKSLGRGWTTPPSDNLCARLYQVHSRLEVVLPVTYRTLDVLWCAGSLLDGHSDPTKLTGHRFHKEGVREQPLPRVINNFSDVLPHWVALHTHAHTHTHTHTHTVGDDGVSAPLKCSLRECSFPNKLPYISVWHNEPRTARHPQTPRDPHRSSPNGRSPRIPRRAQQTALAASMAD